MEREQDSQNFDDPPESNKLTGDDAVAALSNTHHRTARGKFRVRESLRASFKDGVFAALMGGVVDQYSTPLALVLGASVLQVGLVTALPHLFSSLSQIFAVRVIYWVGGRVKLLVRLVASQAFLLLAVALLTALSIPHRVEIFLFFLMLAAACAGLAGPAWGSLMSDYVPADKRGRYFGWRSSVLGAVSIGSVAAAGVLLFTFRKLGLSGGFVALFALAGTVRFISAYFNSRMHEPPHRADPASDFTFLMFLSRFRQSNFLKFIMFAASLNFTTFFAAPFFTVYMLQELHLTYLTYMALQVSSSVLGLVALPLWGRHADLVGNVKVLRLSSAFAALVPFFWLVSGQPLYLMVVQMLSGFAWSGVNLSMGNFIYDAVTPQKRVRCIAYFNVITGVALFLGSGLGGWVASQVQPTFGSKLLTLFLLSGIGRCVVYSIFSSRFREVRRARDVSIGQLFYSVVGIKPLLGPNRD